MNIFPYDFYIRGLLIGWIHLCFGFYFDIKFCKEEYDQLKKQNKELWRDAWRSIQFNLLLITPISYIFLLPWFIIIEDFRFEFKKWIGIILIQNLMYYILHYITIDIIFYSSFHHQFQSILIPSIVICLTL